MKEKQNREKLKFGKTKLECNQNLGKLKQGKPNQGKNKIREHQNRGKLNKRKANLEEMESSREKNFQIKYPN